jgi:hypothetical protein
MPSLTPILVLEFTYNGNIVIGTPQELRDLGIPEATLLGQAKIKEEDRISKHAKLKIDGTVSKEYSAFEASRWTVLAEEAQTYLVTGIASSYLQQCQSDGENLIDYCNQIIADRTQYEYILANIRKTRYDKILEANSLTTPEDVLMFDYTSGWII